jgi:hypothetical protein
MDDELAQYASSAIARLQPGTEKNMAMSVSIEDRMISWDADAAKESMIFVGAALKEIGDEIKTLKPLRCSDLERDESEEMDEIHSRENLERLRKLWIQRQQQQFMERESYNTANESTPLIRIEDEPSKEDR